MQAVVEETHRGAEYLFVPDLQEIFHCGTSKARLMMRTLPAVRIGNSDAVLRSDLDEYVRTNGGIDVKWPDKRKR